MGSALPCEDRTAGSPRPPSKRLGAALGDNGKREPYTARIVHDKHRLSRLFSHMPIATETVADEAGVISPEGRFR